MTNAHPARASYPFSMRVSSLAASARVEQEHLLATYEEKDNLQRVV
jgi:hypothetical protein